MLALDDSVARNVARWLAHKAPRTVAAYRAALRGYLGFVGAAEPEALFERRATTREYTVSVQDFLDTIANRKTYATYASALQGFFRYQGVALGARGHH